MDLCTQCNKCSLICPHAAVGWLQKTGRKQQAAVGLTSQIWDEHPFGSLDWGASLVNNTTHQDSPDSQAQCPRALRSVLSWQLNKSFLQHPRSWVQFALSSSFCQIYVYNIIYYIIYPPSSDWWSTNSWSSTVVVHSVPRCWKTGLQRRKPRRHWRWSAGQLPIPNPGESAGKRPEHWKKNHEKNMENFLDWTPQNHLKCRQCLRKTKEQPLVWGSPVLRNTQVKKVRNNWIFKSSGLILGYSRALLWRNPFHLYIYIYISFVRSRSYFIPMFRSELPQLWWTQTFRGVPYMAMLKHKCSDHPAMLMLFEVFPYFPQSGVHELQVTWFSILEWKILTISHNVANPIINNPIQSQITGCINHSQMVSLWRWVAAFHHNLGTTDLQIPNLSNLSRQTPPCPSQGISMGLHRLRVVRPHLPCWCAEVGRCRQGHRGATASGSVFGMDQFGCSDRVRFSDVWICLVQLVTVPKIGNLW